MCTKGPQYGMHQSRIRRVNFARNVLLLQLLQDASIRNEDANVPAVAVYGLARASHLIDRLQSADGGSLLCQKVPDRRPRFLPLTPKASASAAFHPALL